MNTKKLSLLNKRLTELEEQLTETLKKGELSNIILEKAINLLQFAERELEVAKATEDINIYNEMTSEAQRDMDNAEYLLK